MTERTILYPPTNQMIWNKRVFNLKPDTITELKASMKAVGQLQPIVVMPSKDEDGPFTLIIGRHRYQAVKEMYKEDPSYTHIFLGKPCPPGTVPAIDITDVPPEVLLNMEISENVHRMDLTWQEKAAALALLHNTEKDKFEEKKAAGELPADATYSLSDTAKKLAGVTKGSVHAIVNKVSQSLILAKQLDDPDVAKANGAKEAFNIVRAKLTAEARKLAIDFEGETPHVLLEGDCNSILDDMLMAGDEEIDNFACPVGGYKLILADPPYGIGADTYDNMKEHKYDDSWENAERIYQSICTIGHDLCAQVANMFLFCAPERWHNVVEIAAEAGWFTWFRPIIWYKSNEGMRPHGQQGFAYTYECIMYAWKGNPSRASLIQSHIDVFQIYKVAAAQREHAAAKPVELYAKLIEMTCLPNDWVLDPCVGSGTTFKAGYLRKVRVTGIEQNAETAQTARKNLFWTGEPEAPKVDPEPAFTASLADI